MIFWQFGKHNCDRSKLNVLGLVELPKHTQHCSDFNGIVITRRIVIVFMSTLKYKNYKIDRIVFFICGTNNKTQFSRTHELLNVTINCWL